MYSNLNFEKSSLFLDGSIIIPTVGGLPVNMTALGSSSIQMKSKSSINLQGFLNTGKASLDVDISPSVALKITGLMSVDAFHTKTASQIWRINNSRDLVSVMKVINAGEI